MSPAIPFDPPLDARELEFYEALVAERRKARELTAKVERLERAGRHLADCDFAGTEVEFRCERCVESRAALEGRGP